MNPDSLSSRMAQAFEKTRQALLDERGAHGHWEGELSSSALSTATAVTALAIVARVTREKPAGQQLSGYATRLQDMERRVIQGSRWLAKHANADGGWGDTTNSLSNLSTTVLCWAALGLCSDQQHTAVIHNAERWLRQRTGGLEPHKLAPAVIARYGKDRTFSVPILTMCALAGRLGGGRDAWRWVIPLPFELAACPHQWFAALRLPVVSYALPALIAIGQAHHHHAPSHNPLRRWLRNRTRERTLRILTGIQPTNGGFLEATPLTSFVVMSLAGSGQENHLVTQRGATFLEASQRADGSWPIDTNLATWVTTLAVNALWDSPSPAAPVENMEQLTRWLALQQYREQHPYTHAAPGGWAWTDLPGGVPDADDTSGALLALRLIGADSEYHGATMGLKWLMGLQNRDGGIPTFCRGWGALPFDKSSADITAHAVRAWLGWKRTMTDYDPEGKVMARALRFLGRSQRPDGAWVPLWFGNQHSPTEENPTYGTSRVLAALADVVRGPSPGVMREQVWSMIHRGAAWLRSAQNTDGGWGGDLGTPSTVEESALALEGLGVVLLARHANELTPEEDEYRHYQRGIDWLLDAVESGRWCTASPIGFYFAKLWYHERLYPLIFTVGALRIAMEIERLGPGNGERGTS